MLTWDMTGIVTGACTKRFGAAVQLSAPEDGGLPMQGNGCESILERSPTSYARGRVLFDASGRPYDFECLQVNAACRHLFGLSEDQCVGHRGSELPSSSPRILEALLAAWRETTDGGMRTFDHYFAHMQRWVRISVFSTEPDVFVTAAYDVTADRRRVEDMACLLASSQAFLQQDGASFSFQRPTADMLSISGAKLVFFGLYDHDREAYAVQALAGMPQALAAFDGDGLIGCCLQDSADLIRSLPREGFLTYAGVDAVPEGLLSREILRRLRENGPFGEIVLLGISKGDELLGGFLFVMPLGVPFRKTDVAGIYAHQLGLMLSRHRTEAHLKEREERYRSVTQTTTDGYFVVDLSGRIVEANDAYCAMFGYRRDQLLTLHLWDIVDEKPAERLLEEMAHIRSLGSFHFESVHRRGDGSRCHVHVRIAYQKAQQLYLCFINDITERVRMQQSLREALSAKSQFLANMSHEIRTPMNGFMGMLQLLETTHLDAEQSEYVRVARSSSEILLAVINDILDFSKIESGMMVLERVPFQIRTVVEEVVDLFRAGAARRGIAIRSRVSPEVPHTLLGDAFRLRQILSNLVGNADKFTREGEISIDVTRLGPDDQGRVRIAVSVTDTGSGIPADKIDRLFKSFSQVDPSDTRMHGGSGLGLSICKGLVERMDGEIGVESQPGRGSTFRFTCALWPAGAEAVPSTG